MTAPAQYADLDCINYFDWAQSMTMLDPCLDTFDGPFRTFACEPGALRALQLTHDVFFLSFKLCETL